MLKLTIKIAFSLGMVVAMAAFIIQLNQNFLSKGQDRAASSLDVTKDNGTEKSWIADDRKDHIIDQTRNGSFIESGSLSALPDLFTPGQLSKSQMIVTLFIMALISFLIATQSQVEAGMYEFFHRNDNGTVFFETKESEITHYINIYTGMIFKLLGISCSFLSAFYYLF